MRVCSETLLLKKCVAFVVAAAALWAAECRAEFSPARAEEISAVLEKYVSGKIPEAEEMASKELEKCRKDNLTSGPAVSILEYLSGNEAVSRQFLFIVVEDDREYTALAALAVFTRGLASKEPPDQFDCTNLLSVYMEAEKRCLCPDVKKWKGKVLEWKNWCAENFKNSIGLDPLLAQKSSAEPKNSGRAPEAATSAGTGAVAKEEPERPRSQDFDIEKISPEDFAKLNKIYAKRPRPEGFDFSAKMMQPYVDGLPSKGHKKAEIERFSKISRTKQYLVMLFSKNPYEGIIKNKSNPRGIAGAVSMANLNNIGVRPKGKDKTEIFKWDEFDVSQTLEFLEHYAKQREKTYGGDISKEESIKMAAEDYLTMALLADWYGKDRVALDYARKAIRLNPALKGQISHLMLD